MDIVELYKTKSITDIAKLTGVSSWSVTKKLKSLNVEIRPRGGKLYSRENNPVKAKEIANKGMSTKIKKYGSLSNINPLVLSQLDDKTFLSDLHINKKLSLTAMSDIMNVSDITIKKYMNKHDIQLHRWNTSKGELLLSKWLDDNHIKYERNNRSVLNGMELDFILVDFNIAIEYNGLYWHTSKFINKDYHLNKTKRCELAGIRLIHIFEDELEKSKDKVFDSLRHFVGKSPKGDYARDCSIKVIDWSTANDFLNKYHLLNAGACGNYRIGAYNKNDELIAVMVYGLSSNVVELKRFVTNKRNNPGIASKMIKYAIRQKGYNRIIAFLDRCWFTGVCKFASGFKIIGETKPSLFYTNTATRHHRRFMTTPQLINEYHCDPKLSKRLMLESIGYYPIYDCGKYILELRHTA